MTRRRWRITLLAAAATLAAVYPITSLFQRSTWLGPAIVLIAVSAGVGLLMRGLTRSRVLVVLVQLVVTAYLLLVQFAGDTFTLFVPTISTLEAANNYGLEALDTIDRYSAPAPLSDGVTFYLVAAVTLVAICVDALAATWRSPAAAGLPLLTAYLITAANGDSALALRYFVVPAALWLVMVHTTARAQFGRWSTTSATDEQARAVPHDGAALRAFSSGAAKLGLVGLLVALVVPVFVPHFPPRYLTEGLGRSSGDGSGGGGSVGFNNTIDLTRSLNNDDDSPVLRYTTTGFTRSPLRVLATGYYSRGEWLAVKDSTNSGQPQPLPPPKDRTDYEITVTDNTLAAPNIAAPYPRGGRGHGGHPVEHRPDHPRRQGLSSRVELPSHLRRRRPAAVAAARLAQARLPRRHRRRPRRPRHLPGPVGVVVEEDHHRQEQPPRPGRRHPGPSPLLRVQLHPRPRGTPARQVRTDRRPPSPPSTRPGAATAFSSPPR